MLGKLSMALRAALGRWPVVVVTGLVTTGIFLLWVPRQVAIITDSGNRGGRILDEYYLTWTQGDAERLMTSLGPAGRAAYRTFYLTFDFWLPVLSLTVFFVAALSLAFPVHSRWSLLNLLPLIMYGFDIAENVNHFIMATVWPTQPWLVWSAGPLWTFGKYALVTLCGLLLLAGIASRLITRKVATT